MITYAFEVCMIYGGKKVNDITYLFIMLPLSVRNLEKLLRIIFGKSIFGT